MRFDDLKAGGIGGLVDIHVFEMPAVVVGDRERDGTILNGEDADPAHRDELAAAADNDATTTHAQVADGLAQIIAWQVAGKCRRGKIDGNAAVDINELGRDVVAANAEIDRIVWRR